MAENRREAPPEAGIENKEIKKDLVEGARVLAEMIVEYDETDYEKGLTQRDVDIVTSDPQFWTARYSLGSLWHRLKNRAADQVMREVGLGAEFQPRTKEICDQIDSRLAEHVDLKWLQEGIQTVRKANR